MPELKFVTYMTPGFPVALFEEMASAIDAELHLVQDRSGPDPGDDPFASGRYDLGWICSTSYAALGLSSPQPSIKLAGVGWVPADPGSNGLPQYFGDLVTRAGSDITSFADLAGCTIGCNDEVSLSGHHALRWAIADHGFDPDSFARLEFTGGHHHSLDRLLAGGLDAAVVDSVVRTGRAMEDPTVRDLRIVQRLGPWPTQPMVARADLPQAELDEVRRRLLEAADRPALSHQLQAAGLRSLVSIGSDHYLPVAERMLTAQ